MEVENTGFRANFRWCTQCIEKRILHVFFRPTVLSEQKRLKRDEIDVLLVPRFYRPKVEQEYSTRDRRLHRRSVRFISPVIVSHS